MIEVKNLTKFQIEQALVKRIVQDILKKEKINKEVSIVFVSKERIRELNKKYLKKDKPTDVLSFAEPLDSPNSDLSLGEIIICPFEAEQSLKRVIIHGLLHLLGYDHDNEASFLKMRQKEEYYCQQ